MRKFERVFNNLVSIRADVRGKRGDRIKVILGDSLNNNRTITVNQLVRFSNRLGLPEAALALKIVTDILKEDIVATRGSRTDAIDINELVTAYRTVIMNGRQKRRKIGQFFKGLE